ncbi:hypothetical protein C8Q80DRAFT_1291235 [Daedaleopsis nitida]|nr:hypothetical protein C8Q80DRAFT_1291235 [Daedaleopsis nitida]
MLTSFLAVATLLAGQAAASTSSPADSLLVKREYVSTVENVPSACEETCSGSNKLSDTCHTFDPTTANADYLACFCGDTLHRTLTNCLDCTVGADSSRENELAVQLRDYESACKNVGRALPAFTLSVSSSSTESASATSQSGSSSPTASPPSDPNGSPPGFAISAGALAGAVGVGLVVFA